MGIDRREFLKSSVFTVVSLGLGGGSLAAALEACGGSTASPSGSTASPMSIGDITVQFSSLKDVQFAGSFIADSRGYWKANGLTSVTLLAGGPTTDPNSIVVAGQALVGISSAQRAAPARLAGAPIKIIASKYQSTGLGVVSLATNPVKTPKDMEGRKIGVQAANENLYNILCQLANVDKSKVTKVPIGFDVAPLAAHQVDGLFALVNSQPIALKQQGLDTFFFAVADYGYYSFSYTYVATDDAIKNHKGRPCRLSSW